MKKSKAAVILAVILAAFVGLAYYASIILSSTGIGEDMSIPLGLDLSGGVSITYQAWLPYIRLETTGSQLRSLVCRTQMRF